MYRIELSDEAMEGYIMTEFRIEKDTMGEIKVPQDKFWGAQL